MDAWNGSDGKPQPGRQVLERLGRIEELERAGAPPADLLAELRALVGEAEKWAGVEGGEAAVEAVERIRSALARDMIAA